MWLKAAACVIVAIAIAMSLLALRQRRIDQMHQIAAQHRQMRQARQTLWELQVHIADELQPAKLAQSAQQVGLDLEPVIPARPQQSLASAGSAREAGVGR